MGLFDWKLHDLNGKRDVELVVGVTSFSQQVWIDGVGYQFYDFNMVSMMMKPLSEVACMQMVDWN